MVNQTQSGSHLNLQYLMPDEPAPKESAAAFANDAIARRQHGGKNAAKRATLVSELEDVTAKLAAFAKEDEISTLVKDWKARFITLLNEKKNSNAPGNVFKYAPDELLQERILALQGILIDQLSLRPLEEEALLGSDNKAYNKKTILLHERSPGRGRSPVAPENPHPFTVTAHVVAQHMVEWLKNRNALIRHEEDEKEFKASILADPEPALPVAPSVLTSHDDRLRLLRERQQQRAAKENASMKEFREKLEQAKSNSETQIQQGFAPIHERLQDFEQRTTVRITEIARIDDAEFARLRQVADQQEQDIVQLQAERQVLENVLNKLDDHIDEAKANQVRLQLLINETEQAIKKRKASQFMQLISVVGIVGACIFASYLVPKALKALGSRLKFSALPGIKSAVGAKQVTSAGKAAVGTFSVTI